MASLVPSTTTSAPPRALPPICALCPAHPHQRAGRHMTWARSETVARTRDDLAPFPSEEAAPRQKRSASSTATGIPGIAIEAAITAERASQAC